MAIFNKIKKAFGFSETDIETELNDFTTEESEQTLNKSLQSAHPLGVITTVGNEDQADNGVEVILPEEIFDSVVAIFNESLPSFIKDNVDSQKQRKQIYDSLSESMKDYISRIEKVAKSQAVSALSVEHESLRKKIEATEAQSRAIESQFNDLKSQKLSAERQKRAIVEKVQELETKVAGFDAEREQYELENKSLVNKLRTMDVQSDDIRKLSDENNSLREQIRVLKTGSNKTVENSEEHSRTVAMEEELEKAKTENTQLQNDLLLLKKKCEIADSMINDLNQRSTASQKELGERIEEIARLKSKVSELETQIADNSAKGTTVAEEQHQETAEQLSKALDELEECKNTIKMFEETLTKFEQLKSTKNQTILELKQSQSELKTDNEELTAANKKLAEEVQSLKSTIAENLRLQAESEKNLREELDKAKKQQHSPNKRSKTSKDKGLDTSLTDTDWLISSPPYGEDARPTLISDAEFGYQEPKRKSTPSSDDSPQMLLW